MRSVTAARRLSAIVALAAVVGVVAIMVVVLARHLLLLALGGVAGAATRHALGRDIQSLKSAAVPTPGWSTITALLQTAAGRPVTIEP